VKPPPFDYIVPRSLDGVLEVLADAGMEAKLLAGGQSLIPLLNFRLARPRILVDLRHVPELQGIIEDAGGGLDIGAMVRQRTLEHHPAVGSRAPLAVAATHYVGHLPIRTRGTVGGSLAHADPAAEYPTVALALDATLVACGPGGWREIRASEFFIGFLTTALAPDEVLVRIRLPAPRPRTVSAFLEVARRPGDFAIVAVAAALTLDPSGRVERAAIAVAGAAPAPFRAAAAEEIVTAGRLDRAAIDEAARRAAQATEPETDLQATAEYRRSVAEVLVRRALIEASNRAVAGAAA
jgi:carbon-monoxide dehydrogenase medium subunit